MKVVGYLLGRYRLRRDTRWWNRLSGLEAEFDELRASSRAQLVRWLAGAGPDEAALIGELLPGLETPVADLDSREMDAQLALFDKIVHYHQKTPSRLARLARSRGSVLLSSAAQVPPGTGVPAVTRPPAPHDGSRRFTTAHAACLDGRVVATIASLHGAPGDRLIDDGAAALLLGVGRSTVKSLRKSGALETVRVGGAARVRLSDVQRLVRDGTR